ILRRDPADPWIRLAVLSSLNEGAGEVFASLAADKTWRASDDGRRLLYELARYLGRQDRREEISRLLVTLGSLSAEDEALAIAIVRGLGEGLAKGPGGFQAQLAAIGDAKAQAILAGMLMTARVRAADEAQDRMQRVDAIRVLA